MVDNLANKCCELTGKNQWEDYVRPKELLGALRPSQFIGDVTPLRPLLDSTLLVKTAAFHQMLLARETEC